MRKPTPRAQLSHKSQERQENEETVDPARSALMSRVRGKDSSPEMKVRRTAHSLGYRFRLHSRRLPGTPDLVFPRLRKVIFVHGCFWHRHDGCSRTTTPKTRSAFWAAKFARNIERDQRVVRELRDSGWNVLIVWECQTFDTTALEERLQSFLSLDESEDSPKP